MAQQRTTLTLLALLVVGHAVVESLPVTSYTGRRQLQLKHATEADVAATSAHSKQLFKEVREAWTPVRDHIMDEEVPIMLGKVVRLLETKCSSPNDAGGPDDHDDGSSLARSSFLVLPNLLHPSTRSCSGC